MSPRGRRGQSRSRRRARKEPQRQTHSAHRLAPSQCVPAERERGASGAGEPPHLPQPLGHGAAATLGLSCPGPSLPGPSLPGALCPEGCSRTLVPFRFLTGRVLVRDRAGGGVCAASRTSGGRGAAGRSCLAGKRRSGRHFLCVYLDPKP